jgi:hypothetical protein
MIGQVEARLELLRTIEGGSLGDPLALIAYLAGQELGLPARELNGARRRALLLRAAGGDPRREPELDERAARALALELYSDARRARLGAALDALAPLARELPRVRAAIVFLAADLDLAWRLFVLGLLAEELGADGEGEGEGD